MKVASIALALTSTLLLLTAPANAKTDIVDGIDNGLDNHAIMTDADKMENFVDAMEGDGDRRLGKCKKVGEKCRKPTGRCCGTKYGLICKGSKGNKKCVYKDTCTPPGQSCLAPFPKCCGTKYKCKGSSGKKTCVRK